MGPKPEDVKKGGKGARKLIPTGDPEFPFLYEATDEEAETLRKTFG